jgi:hypothetical protein
LSLTLRKSAFVEGIGWTLTAYFGQLGFFGSVVMQILTRD